MVRPLLDCRCATVQYPCEVTGTARAASGKLTIPVRGPYDCTIVAQMTIKNLACSARSARGLRPGFCDATYDMSMGYGLLIFFQIYLNSSLSKSLRSRRP